MPRALWILLWLNFRAAIRRVRRQLRTVRGILFFAVGVSIVGLWITPQILVNRHAIPPDPRQVILLGPVALLLFCLLNLFTSAGERAVSFTPPEVDFLFPGPFSRRSLLIYKLVKTVPATLISALIFGVILRRIGGLYLYRVAGIWLVFQFMQLLAMTLALVQAIIGERLMARGRGWIVTALAAAAGLAMLQVYHQHPELTVGHLNLSVLAQVRETLAGRVVLAPFVVFTRVLIADELFPEFAAWAGIAVLIDLAMATVVLGLDANYLETASSATAKRYERLSRVRRSGLAGLAKPGSTRWKIPMLPWAAGTGPLVWRQITTVLRTSRQILIIFTLLAVGGGIGLSKMPNENAALAFLIGIIVYISLILSAMLKFDFRGDLDRLDVLRSLPLRPMSVAAAQLAAPSLVLSIVQLLVLATVAAMGRLPWPYFIAAAAFAVPLNVLTIGVDNLLFLLFPIRTTGAVAGDMGMVGRNAIVFVCRLLVVLIVAALCAGVGAGVSFLAHRSWPAAAAAAWLPLAGVIVLITWVIGRVFASFDPSNDTPA